MADFDWITFTARINIKAPVEKLYWCWATRQGIEYWFLRMSEYNKPDATLRRNDEPVQTGDSYRWRWHGWSDEVTEEGMILACNGNNFFKFGFGNAGNCAVTIKTELGEDIVELVQDSIPDDDQGRHYWYVGCKTGWTFYLTNLKSLLEGGIDLRNKREELKNMVNA
jgi:uncharacterized protein YndB with AHSA1/START domain